jgi:hypothetical protein
MHWVAWFRLQDEEQERAQFNRLPPPPPGIPHQATVEKMQNVFRTMGLFKET